MGSKSSVSFGHASLRPATKPTDGVNTLFADFVFAVAFAWSLRQDTIRTLQGATRALFSKNFGQGFPCPLFCLTAYLRGSSISARTLTASLSTSDMQCRYFCVVSISECPSLACTCLMLTPPYNRSVADVWRRLCSLRCLRPCLLRNCLNCLVGVCGFMISPFH